MSHCQICKNELTCPNAGMEWCPSFQPIDTGMRIGDGSIIGGGSVVVKDIPARVIAAGCPARRIK